MVRFALATGLRDHNIVDLQWDQIDMQRKCAWVHADQAKGKRALAVPLSEEALAVITAQIGKHQIHVFTYQGQPVTRANNHAWRKARAGIEDFRFHDLRHTWASWHVQSGTPLHVLQTRWLGSHTDGSTLCTPVCGAFVSLCGQHEAGVHCETPEGEVR